MNFFKSDVLVLYLPYSRY